MKLLHPNDQSCHGKACEIFNPAQLKRVKIRTQPFLNFPYNLFIFHQMNGPLLLHRGLIKPKSVIYFDYLVHDECQAVLGAFDALLHQVDPGPGEAVESLQESVGGAPLAAFDVAGHAH